MDGGGETHRKNEVLGIMPEIAFLWREKSYRNFTKNREKILKTREVRAISNLRKSDSKMKWKTCEFINLSLQRNGKRVIMNKL